MELLLLWLLLIIWKECNMKRGFEVVKGYEDKSINLPVRKTKYSGGNI